MKNLFCWRGTGLRRAQSESGAKSLLFYVNANHSCKSSVFKKGKV